MTIITTEDQMLEEIAEARAEVRRLTVLSLDPHWTSVGRLYVLEQEEAARLNAKAKQRELARWRAQQAKPAKPSPHPPPQPGEQLELFEGLSPIPARSRKRRRTL